MKVAAGITALKTAKKRTKRIKPVKPLNLVCRAISESQQKRIEEGAERLGISVFKIIDVPEETRPEAYDFYKILIFEGSLTALETLASYLDAVEKIAKLWEKPVKVKE